MPFNPFKSKKRSASKGKTMKKSEPINGRQARREFYKDNVKDDEHIEDRIKEGVSEASIEHAKEDDHHDKAVLQPMNRPHRATLIDVLAAPVSPTGVLDAVPMPLPVEWGVTSGARELTSNDGIPNEQQRPRLDQLI